MYDIILLHIYEYIYIQIHIDIYIFIDIQEDTFAVYPSQPNI